MLVMVVVTLLGITFLFQADTENQISAYARDRTQVLGAAEAGARMVKAWFDKPIGGDVGTPDRMFLNTYDLRLKRFFDVDQRLLNADGDPGTATLASGDGGWSYYHEGDLAPASPVADTDTNHGVNFMQKPFRGDNERTLLGTEDGPDLSIREDSSTSTVVAFLDGINDALFGDGFDIRITAIEIYEPPYVSIGGVFERYGIGTVKVTAAKFRQIASGEEKIAERIVKMVLNETPYPGPGGPLESCVGLETAGSFEAHWGTVTAVNDTEINVASLDNKWNSGIPLDTDGYSYFDLDTYMADVGGGAGTDIEDPWLYLRTLGVITDAPNTDAQAWPSVYVPGTGYVGGGSPEDTDHSNLIQNDLTVSCPDMNYDLWKQIAKDGGDNVYYLTWDSGDEYRRNGVGTAKSFLDWVNGGPGLFFFDTEDGREPDGTNWTEAIDINGTFYAEGFIFLNTENFRTTGVNGQDIAMIAPGEPYDDIYTGGAGFSGVYNAEPFTDTNANGRWDAGEPFTDTIPVANGGTDGVYDYEPWVNIDYGTTLGGGGSPPDMTVLADSGTDTNTVTIGGNATTRTTTQAWDVDGLPVQIEANLYGVLYNSGHFSAQGNGVYFGSIVAGNGVGEDYFGAPAAGNPELYFDERLIKGEWPPPELELPMTMITMWKTDY